MSEFTIVLHKNSRVGTYPHLRDASVSCGVSVNDENSVSLSKEGFSLVADLKERHNGTIYSEEANGSGDRSFVISFGWGYRRGNSADQFKKSDMAEFLRSHRSKAIPDVDTLSGIFCILSYDHLSETVWICTDMWAQHGFYYGSNESKVVVSSKASIVADVLAASIDGISYVALLRDAGIPPGRTLYSNVWRGTCGRGLRMDLRERVAQLVQVQPLYRFQEKISFNEAVNRLVDVLSRVCPSAANQPATVVDLTGGNDSRLMAAALSYSHGGKIGKQVKFRVVGDEDHPDVIVARQIATTLGWDLQRNDRTIDQEYSDKSLLESSILSDGNHFPATVHSRLTQESTLWHSFDGLVGSLGGELFRDFFWRHEFLNMGRTSKVNFEALLKYRIYASNDVDVTRVSQGQLSLSDHDQFLLHPYQMVAFQAPDIKNVYKLDVIYLHKLMSRSYAWILSDFRKLILPFLSHEVTCVSLTTPWEFRIHRKLVTAAVERMSPVLSAIPTDKGAPMRPLRFATLGRYARYVANDIWLGYQRHFAKRKRTCRQTPLSIPTEWLDLLRVSVTPSNSGAILSALMGAETDHGSDLSVTQWREIQAVLLIQTLAQQYKGISPSLSFCSRDANFTETTYSL